MNSKSFIFGRNYDSDYLSGKRLKRKSYDQRKDRNFRKMRKIGRKVDKRHEKPNPIEKCRKHLFKTFDNRITLKHKPIDSSTESYHKNYGLYENGKASNVLNKEWVLKDKKQFKARIKEDLFWILNKTSKKKEQIPEEDSSLPQKTRPSLRHKPIYAEKETQINSCISLDTRDSVKEIETISREDKQFFRSKRTENQINFKDISKIANKTPAKGFTKSNLSFHNRSEDMRSNQCSQLMPPLPTSLTVVQNLMKSYENERKNLSKTLPEFEVDLVFKRCNQIKQISKSFKQSIEQNLLRKQNHLNVKKLTIDSTPKSSKIIKNKSNTIQSKDSVPPFSLIPYNQNEAELALKQFEPKVGNMLSRLLLNISEAFQTLSAKCGDKSFFE